MVTVEVTFWNSFLFIIAICAVFYVSWSGGGLVPRTVNITIVQSGSSSNANHLFGLDNLNSSSAASNNFVKITSPNIGNKNNKDDLPKVLWMYWAQGMEHLQSLSGNHSSKYVLDATCVKAMTKMNPDWDVRILSENDAKMLAPTYASLLNNESLAPKLEFRMKSNLLRIELLSRYGGVYADTSICPFVQLDDFIHTLIGNGKYGFFAPPLSMGLVHRRDLPANATTCHVDLPENLRSKEFRSASSWFLASNTPNNPLLIEWLNTYSHHLLTKDDPSHPYYLVQCSLTQARMANPSVELVWASTMTRHHNSGLCTGKFGSFHKWATSKHGEVGWAKQHCRVVKKPQQNKRLTEYLLSEEYMDYIEEVKKKGEGKNNQTSL
mmetsp:Transcript_335/g.655  ORF Transcript_335/g.655 Transcript_335/m.655 type:complete len:380 (+) Transcript_335:244-1383(+)|eukprot:CAMPEP_0183713116 /NCGR_PEP_ID=MMETSP0737-20130205/8074_1 /TAXON_ID=385413 /ORGANISM="Thalassiosira miniscula, Strain CCMP1093" /LENGTH=379 /DNA_ID=CAMNT_0025941865 /DNA_START=212 /DNA_END=1351 /DNA_ORIENTATION=-